ncbi:MAG: 50S ribosomal protein L9 [Armatimonadetes bacterium]|nr:50S ribosomal protein L9 [Armatimonadota bacterium]
MKVILTQDIKELGKAGQLVNVSEGYGRNFLIPRKLAVMADSGAMKNLETKKHTVKAKSDKMLTDANALAEKINKLKVIIKGKSGAGTRLYGSITSQEIADALKAQHKITVDKRKISISEPIKTTGMFEVSVKLHQDVSTVIHVEVVGQE